MTVDREQATPDFARWKAEAGIWEGADYLWLNRFTELYRAHVAVLKELEQAGDGIEKANQREVSLVQELKETRHAHKFCREDADARMERIAEVEQELEETNRIAVAAMLAKSEAKQLVGKLREEIERAIERLEKFRRKGPKQVGRAIIGLERALGRDPLAAALGEPSERRDPNAAAQDLVFWKRLDEANAQYEKLPPWKDAGSSGGTPA